MRKHAGKYRSTVALRRRNVAMAVVLLGIVLTMGLLAINSLALYQLFIRLTGYRGAPQMALAAPKQADSRVVTVRFDVTVAPGMPWQFTVPAPARGRLGEEATATFTAKNIGNEPVLGTATYNVTPFKAGPYFDIIRCFCSTDHVLLPGEKKQFSVTFFVDPKVIADRNTNDVSTITLSFTYFNISDTLFKRRSAARDRSGGITR